MPATVKVRWYDGEGTREGGVADIPTARAAGCVWVDVSEPDAETLAPLAEAFSLHPLAVEDCLHTPQRPKLDPYGETLFLVWVIMTPGPGRTVEYTELAAFLGKCFLITAHREPVPLLDEVGASAYAILARGADWALHSILDRAVDNVFPIVDAVSEDLDRIEDQMLADATRQQLHGLYAVKRMLTGLHRVVAAERDAVRAMARQEELISREAYLYFQDVGDHLSRVADSVDTYRDVASGAMDIYLSSVSNKLNDIMKRLTIVATIFMPLTLLSGIYGMNVLRGMWPPAEAVWSFPLLIASMLGIVAGMLLYFRRRGWW